MTGNTATCLVGHPWDMENTRCSVQGCTKPKKRTRNKAPKVPEKPKATKSSEHESKKNKDELAQPVDVTPKDTVEVVKDNKGPAPAPKTVVTEKPKALKEMRAADTVLTKSPADVRRIGVLGLPGAGKTLFIVEAIMAALGSNEGADLSAWVIEPISEGKEANQTWDLLWSVHRQLLELAKGTVTKWPDATTRLTKLGFKATNKKTNKKYHFEILDAAGEGIALAMDEESAHEDIRNFLLQCQSVIFLVDVFSGESAQERMGDLLRATLALKRESDWGAQIPAILGITRKLRVFQHYVLTGDIKASDFANENFNLLYGMLKQNFDLTVKFLECVGPTEVNLSSEEREGIEETIEDKDYRPTTIAPEGVHEALEFLIDKPISLEIALTDAKRRLDLANEDADQEVAVFTNLQTKPGINTADINQQVLLTRSKQTRQDAKELIDKKLFTQAIDLLESWHKSYKADPLAADICADLETEIAGYRKQNFEHELIKLKGQIKKHKSAKNYDRAITEAQMFIDESCKGMNYQRVTRIELESKIDELTALDDALKEKNRHDLIKFGSVAGLVAILFLYWFVSTWNRYHGLVETAKDKVAEYLEGNEHEKALKQVALLKDTFTFQSKDELVETLTEQIDESRVEHTSKKIQNLLIQTRDSAITLANAFGSTSALWLECLAELDKIEHFDNESLKKAKDQAVERVKRNQSRAALIHGKLKELEALMNSTTAHGAKKLSNLGNQRLTSFKSQLAQLKRKCEPYFEVPSGEVLCNKVDNTIMQIDSLLVLQSEKQAQERFQGLIDNSDLPDAIKAIEDYLQKNQNTNDPWFRSTLSKLKDQQRKTFLEQLKSRIDADKKRSDFTAAFAKLGTASKKGLQIRDDLLALKRGIIEAYWNWVVEGARKIERETPNVDDLKEMRRLYQEYLDEVLGQGEEEGTANIPACRKCIADLDNKIQKRS